MTFTPFRSALAALLVLAGFSLLSASSSVAQTPSVVADLNDGSSSSFPAEFVQIDDAGTPTLIFAATGNNASGSNIGRELWKTDGTSAGTVLVRDISAGSNSSNPSDLVVLGNTVFFSCTTGTAGRELCQSDGTQAGTGVLKDINPGSNGSRVTGLMVVGGQLFFFADNGVTGIELWVSDGTEIGTQLVQDIYPGPTPLNRARSGFNISLTGRFAGTDDTFYFMANDGTTGLELWASDGTSAGTRNVREIEPGDRGPQQLRQFTTLGNLLVFESQVGFGEREVWVSDGTELGTNPADGVVGGVNGSGPEDITRAGDAVFFYAFDASFTSGLYRFYPVNDSSVQLVANDLRGGFVDNAIVAYGEGVVFSNVTDAGIYEIWYSDGTDGVEARQCRSRIWTGTGQRDWV